ncbi:MAG: VCBS repeat-containing protein [Clostridia bacterium]|nr:VCBS repeat-containing protein [Clostridia bacterium]
MNKKILTAAIAILTATLLVACKPQQNTRPSDTTASLSDWRNSIEYESFFFVNSETKLLYALDVGSITLWNNAGDGTVLQTIEYDSAASNAIESIEFKDVNLDGHSDIMNLYSETDTGKKYNLWLWDAASGKYVECKMFRGINDPVISEDGKTVSGEEDMGVFGTVLKVYNITDALMLEEASVTMTNANDIAAAISADILEGADITKADGAATIDEVSCPVYYVERDGARIAFLAYSFEGHWYLDEGCKGIYRLINNTDGTYVKGLYTGQMGALADVAAELFECDPVELTVGDKTVGILCHLSYSESGTPILPDPDAEPEGTVAEGYWFMRGEELLCNIVSAGGGVYYCYAPDITGDSFYHLLQTTGEAGIVPGTASEYYTDLE